MAWSDGPGDLIEYSSQLVFLINNRMAVDRQPRFCLGHFSLSSSTSILWMLMIKKKVVHICLEPLEQELLFLFFVYPFPSPYNYALFRIDLSYITTKCIKINFLNEIKRGKVEENASQTIIYLPRLGQWSSLTCRPGIKSYRRLTQLI